MIGHLGYLFVSFVTQGDQATLPGFDLRDVSEDFGVGVILGAYRHDRHIFVDERDWAVFHFSRRIALRVDVRDFFEFQGAFEGRREVGATAEEQEVGIITIRLRDFFDLVVFVEDLPYLIWKQLEMIDLLLSFPLGHHPHSAQVQRQ